MSATDRSRVALFGARSPVGEALVELLAAEGDIEVLRFSRRPQAVDAHGAWRRADDPGLPATGLAVSLVPVWALPDLFPALERMGCERVVALSSTSRFTKQDSGRPADRDLAARLRAGEDEVLAWGRRTGTQVVVLRPTMIYGHPADGNVAAMRRVLRRFRVFPVVGRGQGLRQPVHVDDVARACVAAALHAPVDAEAASYTLSGGEVLTYREMVDRVRRTVAGPTAVVRVPMWAFRAVERVAPRSRVAHLAAGMADRMSSDMVFAHAEAEADLDFYPGPFDPAATRSKPS